MLLEEHVAEPFATGGLIGVAGVQRAPADQGRHAEGVARVQPCARQTVPVMVWVKRPLVRSSTPMNVSAPVAPANMPVP